jgi:hydroxymethylglutaryl-CoA reductase
MVVRGGGIRSLQVRKVRKSNPESDTNKRILPGVFSDTLLVVHIVIDVQEAMGANIATTVAESVAPFLAGLSGGRPGVRIISNLCPQRMARVSFFINGCFFCN